MSRPKPWAPLWRFAAVALLGGALYVSLDHGRTWDALIIGVLLVPMIVLFVLTVWAYVSIARMPD